MAAFAVADDLFKSANGLLEWDEHVASYLEASASVFYGKLRSRGYIVHYVADARFEDPSDPVNLISLQRPIDLFPAWCACAGLQYISPQLAALKLMEADGIGRSSYFDYIEAYIEEAQLLAHSLVDRCREDHRHYCFVNFDRQEVDTVEYCSQGNGDAGIITVFRNEACVPGSKCRLFLPKAPWRGSRDLCSSRMDGDSSDAVSYTHLTLPTILLV